MLLVRSYRTFAPLPVPENRPSAVFLWHSPHGHPHWALPSKLGHQGARTFSADTQRDRPQPPAAFRLHHALGVNPETGVSCELIERIILIWRPWKGF